VLILNSIGVREYKKYGFYNSMSAWLAKTAGKQFRLPTHQR